jgi:hypothetical protein
MRALRLAPNFNGSTTQSALAGLIAALDLIDDVDAAATTHELIGAVASAKRFQ